MPWSPSPTWSASWWPRTGAGSSSSGARGGDRVEDLLWWQDDRLLGFLGLYAFGPVVELAGMVAPDARRRGIATALLDVALTLCGDRWHRQVQLVVPRAGAAGRALALRRGAVLDRSEHALVLATEPPGGATDPRTTFRAAGPADAGVVQRLLAALGLYTSLGFRPVTTEDYYALPLP